MKVEKVAVTWWLSFADDKGYLGAVLVDGIDDFLRARLAMSDAGVKSPGGECVGVVIRSDQVPPQYRDAWAALPRLTLLQKDDFRTMGPLVNMAGEAR